MILLYFPLQLLYLRIVTSQRIKRNPTIVVLFYSELLICYLGWMKTKYFENSCPFDPKIHESVAGSPRVVGQRRYVHNMCVLKPFASGVLSSFAADDDEHARSPHALQ